MSFNPNFYKNVQPNFTFQERHFTAPPPDFNPHIPPPLPPPKKTDEEFVKRYDNVPSKAVKLKTVSTVSITKVKKELSNLIVSLNNLKLKEKHLQENVSSLPEAEWSVLLQEIAKNKESISKAMTNMNDSYLETLRKVLAKRSAKRLRLKRVREEKKKEKEDRIRKLEEKSRKIDEHLQKVKDDISRAKQEEEAKIKADSVLKEVLRKKHDGKKSIVKLDAMLKLYKARQNTARGRGEAVSERNAENFNSNIAKLKSLWTQKLQIYEQEEAELQKTLKQDSEDTNEKNIDVLNNLAQWQEFLYGGKNKPQADFQGDIGQFVAIRSHWDQYINEEGTTLPVGWVLPNIAANMQN